MPIIAVVILVHSHKGKARQYNRRQDEIYIDPLHIMTMTTTITTTMTMTIIIQ